MRKIILLLQVAIILSALSSCKKDEPTVEKSKLLVFAPQKVAKTNTITTYVHYMPWFETPETNNGKWGYHWTMKNMNPDKIDVNGKREIASHYYPLIGPYASSDPAVIEYHLLLMKYSGIEGVLIDWYGSSDLYDYGAVRKNTEALIDELSRVGLTYAIVYEDRTIEAAVKSDNTIDKIERTKLDMTYLEDNYFNSTQYIKIDNNPLLLVFGPEYLKTQSDWTQVFEDMYVKPCFLSLNYNSFPGSNASGQYVWVDAGSLDSKYKTMSNYKVFMGGAYPGFNDYYMEGGAGATINLPYPHNGGLLYKQNLQLANKYKPKYLQLITWNDFGEGTMIEPSEEFGYSFLESTQEFVGVSYTKTELTKIHDLYILRNLIKKKIETDEIKDAKMQLDQAFYYFVSLQPEKASQITDSLMLVIK